MASHHSHESSARLSDCEGLAQNLLQATCERSANLASRKTSLSWRKPPAMAAGQGAPEVARSTQRIHGVPRNEEGTIHFADCLASDDRMDIWMWRRRSR